MLNKLDVDVAIVRGCNFSSRRSSVSLPVSGGSDKSDAKVAYISDYIVTRSAEGRA